MDKRFERRLERAANPRARKRNEKHEPKFVRAKSHVEATMRDMMAEEGVRGGGIFHPNPVVMAGRITESLAAPALAVRELAIAVGMDAVDAVKRRMGKKERMKKLAKRRKYYAAEAARRAERREQVMAAMPKPANRRPTAKQLNEAYLHRREGEEAQRRFGELMIDLEENERRAFAITGNRITGVAGGVKVWLKANCPMLAAHYSTCQRYKRLAQEYYDTKVKN